MKYNLTKYTQTISNIVEGDIDLTTDEIINIINTTTAQVPVPASGTASGTLVLDCDLGARVHIDEVQYYFDSVLPTSTAASGIKFYYKNEDFEIYTSLNTFYNENYYYTIVSGTSAPRYIRVEHTTVSGLGGYVNSLYILNDDTYVDFGDDGADTNTNFSLSLEDSIIEINNLEVFNSGPVKANAKLIIEPQNTKADDILSISDSVDGPWYGVYRDDDMVTGLDLWETGNMVDLQVSSDVLKLSNGKTTGTYTTRIVDLDEAQRLTFNIINFNYPTTTTGYNFISTSSEDTTETIEVRSYNSDPMPRESYIYMTGSYGSSTKYTNHYWTEDGSLDEQSADWGTWGRTGNYWEYWYDSVSEDEYIIDKSFYTAGNTTVYFRIRNKAGTLYSTTITNSGYTSDCFYSTYKVSPVSTGGFWINFFLARGDINNGIYYLRYYNSTMTQMYNRQANAAQGTFMYDMDVVYDTGHLWYTDLDLSTVFKINTDGTVLASYLATQDIRGILALSDGGCWFIQQEVLIRLDTNGQFVEDIELPVSVGSYIYSDLNGGFWLQAGDTIYHLRSDGTEYFNVTIQDLYHIIVMNSGVLTKQHDGSTTSPPQASYVSKSHQRIIRTWDYPQNEGGYVGTFDTNRYGARSQTYDDIVDDHASHFPIAIDTQWNNFSEWTTVSLRDYNFTNEQYHQLRFTLRADNSVNSPEVYGLWTQRAIEISNIYPGNYGRFYLKSDVTYLAPQDVGNYISKIRAYWLLNTE